MKKIIAIGVILGLSCNVTVFANPFYVKNTTGQWSIVKDGKVKKTLDGTYQNMNIISSDLIQVVDSQNKVGLVDSKFKVIVPTGTYDTIDEWIEGYAIVEKADKSDQLMYAVIDKKGKEVVPLSYYTEVKRILNNSAISVIDQNQNKVFVYDNKLNLLNQISFVQTIQKVNDFQGIFAIDQKVYNKQGQYIGDLYDKIKNHNQFFFEDRDYDIAKSYLKDINTGKEYGQYDKVFFFEKYALVSLDGKKGIIGKNGKIYVECDEYDEIETLSEDLYVYNQEYLMVKKGGQMGVIHYTGDVVVPLGKYKTIKSIIKRAFFVEDRNSEEYYVSYKDEVLDNFKGYSYYSFLDDNRALMGEGVYKMNVYVINTNNNKKLYRLRKNNGECKAFTEDIRLQNAPKNTVLICDYQNDVLKIIDKNGKTIAKKGLFTILDSFDGTYIVDITANGKYRVITKKGKEIVKPLYDKIVNKNGYFYATKGKKTVVFDKNGKIVVQLGTYSDIYEIK